jgi:hypothetical protein
MKTDMHKFETHSDVYEFQSQHGLDLDGWRIRKNDDGTFRLEQICDGKKFFLTEDEYDNLVNGD